MKGEAHDALVSVQKDDDVAGLRLAFKKRPDRFKCPGQVKRSGVPSCARVTSLKLGKQSLLPRRALLFWVNAFCSMFPATKIKVGAAISGPKMPNRLSERILPEEELQRIIALESDLRNHGLLRLFYVSGGRVSEVADLNWRALRERRAPEGKITGQVTFQGKGEKTRSVLLTPLDVGCACGAQLRGNGCGLRGAGRCGVSLAEDGRAA